MRFFNTAGPCEASRHYLVPPMERLPEAPRFVERFQYFVVHAPRQSGKTTSLRAFVQHLTASGQWAALLVSCEGARMMGDDYGSAEEAILTEIALRSQESLPSELRPPQGWPIDSPAGSRISGGLTEWSRACPRPIVLVLDEIDALTGASLLSVLAQLRAGHASRPGGFPASVVLCGMRAVRDYKMASGGGPVRLGSSSPFNVLVESLRIDDFSESDIRSLYGQHTAETGQAFEEGAIQAALRLSGGQPWLVNALAREVVEKMGILPSEKITAEQVEKAGERLILARATHLDSLASRLTEDRVRRILEPMISGGNVGGDTYDDDFQYVRDLGLIGRQQPARMSNPIYREVIVRVLSLVAEGNIAIEPHSFKHPDGSLDIRLLLEEFRTFWIENGDVLAGRMPYHEVSPQLVIMAFLQRVVNGGGLVDREYGIGRGRIDLLVRWPLPDRSYQREALELKVWAPKKRDPTQQGLKQLDDYLARVGLDHGWLVLFDRRPEAPPIDERTTLTEERTPSGRVVGVLRA